MPDLWALEMGTPQATGRTVWCGFPVPSRGRTAEALPSPQAVPKQAAWASAACRKRYRDVGRVEVRAVFYLTEHTQRVTRVCEWPKNTAGFGFGCLHAKSWKPKYSSHTEPIAVKTEHPWGGVTCPLLGRQFG